MKEIYQRLFIGNQNDYEFIVKNKQGWAVVHACKIPYHKQLLGYKTQGAPKDHPEYFFAERDERLYLNLVDAPDPKYIPAPIIDKTMDFISKKLNDGKNVLVHCNQGMSRSAIIGLLFLAQKGLYSNLKYSDAEKAFIRIYPNFNPGNGVREYARQNWDKYCR